MSDTASPRAEAAALAGSAGVRLRDDLLAVHVSGEDRLTWLNGQITNDLRPVSRDTAIYALAVTVRGKIMADLWVLDRGSELCVLLPHDAADVVLESFDRQIIMEDVELTRDPDLRVISVQGPRAREVAAAVEPPPEVHGADELGHGGALVLAAASETPALFDRLAAEARRVGGGAVSEAGFDLARVRAGRPRFGRDFGAQQYPQEAGLKERAVSFGKGCYLGQEVVCTLENRGRLTRRLVRFETTSDAVVAPQTPLLDADGAAAGHVTTALLDPELGRGVALGYVKSALALSGREFSAGDARLSLIGLVGEG